MSISSANPTVATFNRYRYVAVGAETSVSGADANGNVLSYSPGREQVYLNGVMLVRGQDYTATTGSSVTALTALVANDVVEVLAFTSFAVAAGVAQDESPSSPAEGQLWLDTNGTAPGVQFARWSKTMSGGVTSVTGTDDNSITLAYTAGYESVYRNGILLSRVNDYTATNGTSITLVDATIANDIIEVFAPTSIGFSDAIPNSIVDAKGDLITASSNNTPAILTVGESGSTLVADSSASTGLRWQGSQAAGRNAVINGAFDIWQRGTSFTDTSSSTGLYGPDRWNIYNGRSGTTYSRQNASLDGIQYSLRVQRNSGNTATTDIFLTQCLASEESYRFAGKQVTLSFWAKAGANYSASSSGLVAQIRTGTGTDQNLWVAYTGTSTIANSTVTLTTSWQRFTVTGTAASTATEILTLFAFTPTGTAGTNDWFEITGVQLEIGSVATPFSRAGATLAGELAACQRYYYRNNYSGLYCPQIIWMATSTTNLITTYQHPVVMRSNPTLANGGSAQGYPPILDRAGTFSSIAYYTGSGFTAQYSYRSTGNVDGTSYTEFSAEL